MTTILIGGYGCAQRHSRDLVTAIITGDASKVRDLLDKGANASALVKLPDKDRHLQRIMMGISEKEVEDDKALKKTLGFSTLQFFDTIELTPLMAATRMGNVNVAHLLLTKAANVNVRNSDGFDALMIAANKGDLEIATMLLAKGADATSRTQVGETALMMAVTNNHLPVARLLLDRRADVHAKLLRNQTQDDSNALMIAAEGGQPDMVRILLEKGADVNAKTDAFGETALIKTVKLVVEKRGRAITGTGDPKYLSQLDNERLNLMSCIKLLRQKGADVHAKDTKGHSALSIAKEAQDLKLIDLLELSLADEPHATP
jgi:FOG: Ankyrin repeat